MVLQFEEAAMNRIELKVHKVDPKERRCVQISGVANTVLMELYRATGLPVEYIVSQMIIQGAPLIDIVEETDEGEEK